MRSAKQAAEAWACPTDSVDTICRVWGEMYAAGRWTLEELEAHAEAMLPALLATRGTEAS